MSRRPTRRGGGHSGGSAFGHRDLGVASSIGNNIVDGAPARSSQPNCDGLDRALQQIIHSSVVDAGLDPHCSRTPSGSHVSSCSSNNNKGTYKGLSLEKTNKARGERLDVEITSDTRRPSVREQATALAYEMGLACRECLPLFGDWRNVDINLKKLAFERINARLKLINLEDLYTYDCHLRHMALIRRRWRWRVREEFLINGDEARPTHTTVGDWEKIKQYWQSLEDQRERHESDPTQEKRNLSEIGETACSHVVNLHSTGPVAHTTLRDELVRALGRQVGRIEMFERTRRKDVITPDRPDGWLPGTKATYDKLIQVQNDALAAGTPQTDDEVVDSVMNAFNRSNCKPGAGYGPKAIGRSFKRPCSKQQYRDEFVATQRKNKRLEANIMLLMESQAKLYEEMAQIRALLSRNSHDTSANIGQSSSSQHPPS